ALAVGVPAGSPGSCTFVTVCSVAAKSAEPASTPASVNDASPVTVTSCPDRPANPVRVGATVVQSSTVADAVPPKLLRATPPFVTGTSVTPGTVNVTVNPVAFAASQERLPAVSDASVNSPPLIVAPAVCDPTVNDGPVRSRLSRLALAVGVPAGSPGSCTFVTVCSVAAKSAEPASTPASVNDASPVTVTSCPDRPANPVRVGATVVQSSTVADAVPPKLLRATPPFVTDTSVTPVAFAASQERLPAVSDASVNSPPLIVAPAVCDPTVNDGPVRSRLSRL